MSDTAVAEQGHPKGLWVLFITEMWERFSYYGMRAILVLYLIAKTDEINAGFGWTEDQAYDLYGLYTSAVYLTPIIGGLLADKFLGTHRSMIIGGWIIALGHITLALVEVFGFSAGSPVGMENGAAAYMCFILGLFLIVVGTGFFKPCVSVMVGQLYGDDDPRRDSGFTIFYMGINLGAFFSPLVAGTLGEKVGWHYGFGSAAVGMIAGLFVYQFLRPKYLQGIGLPPKEAAAAETDPVQREKDEYERTRPLEQKDWHRIAVIMILAFFGNIFFWAAFEQAGSSLNVFAKDSTDRTLWGLVGGDGFPASWYQSMNPLVILVFAPVFAWMWTYLAKIKKSPSTPVKFAIGLYLLGLGFIFMIFGADAAKGGALAGPQWLFLTYLVVTWGELALSPVGLSMVTRLSPKRLQAMMMGLWFLSFSLSNLLAAQVAKLSTRIKSGEMTFVIEGLPGFFLLLVVLPVGAGVVLHIFSKKLSKMMHGLE